MTMQIHFDHLQTNRIMTWTWRFGVLVALVVVGHLVAAGCHPASAQGPGEVYSGAAPAPVGAVTGRLDTQIVDVQIEERAGHAFASVRCVFQIQNPDKEAAQAITLTWPTALPNGLTFDPAALSDVSVDVDGQPKTLIPMLARSPVTATGGVTVGYSLAVTVPSDDMAAVGLRYRQDLGDASVATFHFAGSVGGRWPGPLSSSRLTVKFPDQTSPEQLVEVRPADAIFDGQALTWYYSNAEPRQDTELVFVRPSLWHDVSAARLRVTNAPDSVEAHYELASLYRRLIPTSTLTGTLESPFQGLMVAELEAVRQAARPEHDPLLCQVDRELADVNRARAYRPDGSIDELYLSQWIRDLQGTLDTCPSETRARDQDIRAGYLQLARLSRMAGRYEVALQQLDAAEKAGSHATQQDSQPSELTVERRLCYLGWVRDLFLQGDVSGAFRLAEKGLRPDDMLPVTGLIPRFTTVQMFVATGRADRRLTVTLKPYLAVGNDPSAELKKAVEGAGLVGVSLSANADQVLLDVTVPFAGGPDLLRKQQALAQALPDWPELALVRAILSPAVIELGADETWYSTTARYRETVDTSRAEVLLRQRAQAAEQKRAQLQAGAQVEMNGGEAQAVAEVQQQALSAAASAWQDLLENSRGTFDMSWTPVTGGRVERVWSITVGQTQDMRLDSKAFKWSSITTIAALAVSVVLIVVLVLLLFARLSRGHQ
jgi:hypothetical protein